jgi:hypothetical protein
MAFYGYIDIWSQKYTFDYAEIHTQKEEEILYHFNHQVIKYIIQLYKIKVVLALTIDKGIKYAFLMVAYCSYSEIFGLKGSKFRNSNCPTIL